MWCWLRRLNEHMEIVAERHHHQRINVTVISRGQLRSADWLPWANGFGIIHDEVHLSILGLYKHHAISIGKEKWGRIGSNVTTGAWRLGFPGKTHSKNRQQEHFMITRRQHKGFIHNWKLASIACRDETLVHLAIACQGYPHPHHLPRRLPGNWPLCFTSLWGIYHGTGAKDGPIFIL